MKTLENILLNTSALKQMDKHTDCFQHESVRSYKFITAQSKKLPNPVELNWIFWLMMIKLGFTEGRNEIITKRPSS